MDRRTFFRRSLGFAKYDLNFEFTTNGQTAPSLSSLVGADRSHVSTLERTGSGIYTVTLSKASDPGGGVPMYRIVCRDACVNSSTYQVQGIVSANEATTNGITLTIYTVATGTSTLTDAGTSVRIGVNIVFRNASAPTDGYR
jgi:hypothetical protein